MQGALLQAPCTEAWCRHSVLLRLPGCSACFQQTLLQPTCTLWHGSCWGNLQLCLFCDGFALSERWMCQAVALAMALEKGCKCFLAKACLVLWASRQVSYAAWHLCSHQEGMRTCVFDELQTGCFVPGVLLLLVLPVCSWLLSCAQPGSALSTCR